MEREIPKIDAVAVAGPMSLRIRWRQDILPAESVNLAGWIATGGELLAPLKDPAVFTRAHVAANGGAVAWDDDDLMIDSMHLKLLMDEQRPFGNNDVRAWQSNTGLSNSEAADLIGVSLSTWNTYRADAAIPPSVAIVLRSSERDPLILQAHLRPRTAGRPRKAVE
jgi:hypothetical protein